MNIIVLIVSIVVSLAVGAVVAIAISRRIDKAKGRGIIEEATREAEMIKKNKIIEAKEAEMEIKSEAEKAANARLSKVQTAEAKLKQREMQMNQQQSELQKKKNEVDAMKGNLENQLALVDSKQAELDKMQRNIQETLEHVSGLSAEEAKEKLVESLKDEAKTAAASYINDIMDDAKMTANKEAKRIVVQTIQRVATETAIENAVTVFHIDSDEIKGRIIGREGRNIRALEAATGIEIIVDDTPEAIVLSGFDPVRRETARIALERLIQDGRIHPARIEETVEKVKKELDQQIKEAGEAAMFECGIFGLHPELVKLLGRLKFRTSYGQNVLRHSVEVSHLAGVMATELGVDPALAKRAGLLHDIGKAVDFEIEGTHMQIGADLAKKYRENHSVVNAILAHHGDVEPKTIEAVLVASADAISGARPGARRETTSNYIKRLQKLEEISGSFKGVEKCYAIQAGREVRVMVKPEQVNDAQTLFLAKEIAKKIEQEMEYPGQIKVNVIREWRATEFAK